MLPYARQLIDDEDVASVAAALRGELLTTGPLVEQFETALAQATGSAYAVACNNGTSALYMAARALGLGPGDAVIVPSQTFLATASGPHLAGAEVVFADVDPETGLVGPGDLEQAIASTIQRFPSLRLRAAFVVHLNGQVADLPALKAVCDSHGLAMIEDAAHAVGGLARCAGDTESDGKESHVGDCRWSVMATFSFHPVKTIAMGEGGAVTTNDDVLAARLRRLRNQGMERDSAAWQHRDAGLDSDSAPNPWYYEMAEPSLNFRVPDILCALGISQLRKLTAWVAERRRLFERYQNLLTDIGAPVRPPATVHWGAPAWHLAAARIAFDAVGPLSRAEVMRRLRTEHGVGTQVHYIPVHGQPYWRRRHGPVSLPGAEAYYAQALSLPLYIGLSDADQDRVCTALKTALGVG